MPTIKCPKCATLMKLKQQAVAVKVKCPKCQTLLKVPGSGAADAAPTKPAKQSIAQPAPAANQAATKSRRPKAPVAKAVTDSATATVSDTDPFVAEDPFVTEDPLANDNPFADLPAAGFDTPADAAPAAGTTAEMGPGGFDFGNIDLPAAAPAPAAFPGSTGGSFPAAAGPLDGGAHPYAKPAAPPAPTGTGETANHDKRKKLIWIGAGSGVLLLVAMMIGLVILAVNAKESKSASQQSEVAIDIPDGFKGGKVGRVSFAIPIGKTLEMPPTSNEAMVIESDSTGATFFVGLDKYEYLNPSTLQLSYRAGRMIMSDVYGAERVERNGDNGHRAGSYGGLVLTNMTVEYFLVDGEVILVGCGLPIREVADEDLGDPIASNAEPTAEEIQLVELFESEKKAFFDSIQL